MMMSTLVKMTLSEQIYNILKNEIMSGTIPLGSKITNRELQERFLVSSTPVRDTINKLYQDGLVKEVTKTGAQVISFDYGYAAEINEFIAAISCVALNMTIAKGADKEVTKHLKEYLKKQTVAPDDDAYFDADFHFHKSFFDFCGNQFLKETYKRYNLIRFLLIKFAIRTAEDRSCSTKQHGDIVTAYSSGQFDLASQLLEQHYIHGLSLIKGYNP
ncbi:GntR family transcriptional regulator [Lacrimispora brassicae]